jgi:5-methylcytosine-specific restriction endonuclease McrA
MFKICTACKMMKSNYSNNKNNKDGLSYHCKDCVKCYKQQNKNRANFLKRLSNLDFIKNFKNKEQSRKYHLSHREERILKQKKYYLNNKNTFQIKNKIYRQNHKDQILLRNRQRRQKLYSYPIIQQSEIDFLLINCKNQCFYCMIDVKRGINLHLDHKIPLCRGGEHIIDNLVPACASCNLQKVRKLQKSFYCSVRRNKE